MKKNYSVEEKKAYYAEQKKKVEQALIDGVKHCFTEGNFKKYLDTVSKFHDYSLRNCMLITMQCPEATLVAGYRKWQKDFKRHVKAGEKAINIIAPTRCTMKVKDRDIDGNEIDKEVQFNRYRIEHVFDISQTEGEELPTICKTLTDDVNDFEMLKWKIETVAGIDVRYEEIKTGANGYYDSMNNVIVIKKCMPQAQTIKTLVHEVAHSILHNDVFCNIPRKVKEVQAESVAYMVCKEFGIDTDDYSFEYVASWAELDLKTLTDQMEIVRKTSDSIIEKIKNLQN